MRPELAITLLRATAIPEAKPTIDIESKLWRQYELLFRREYKDEHKQIEWIDHGGEG